MKHVTFGEKSLLVDDETADWLLEYATALAVAGSSDHVTIDAVGSDGNAVSASFLLNSGTEMMTETANSNLVPPANPESVRYMKERTSALRDPPFAQPFTAEPPMDGRGDVI